MMLEMPKGFEFGTVETDEDLEDLLRFNKTVHQDDDPEELRRMIENLPGFERNHNLFIRDLDSGKIVSSINAIPSIWMYEHIPIKNLEMGWVGTLEEYRQKGLVRILNSYFEEMLDRGKYHISTIQGIPYFYRQFGYDFVIPMEPCVFLRLGQIPSKPEGVNLREIREAKSNDIDELMELYNLEHRDLLLSTKRTESIWELQEKFRKEYDREFQTCIVERDGNIEGYFRTWIEGNPKKDPQRSTLVVSENSISVFDAVMTTLYHLKEKATNLGVNQVRIIGPKHNNLLKLARDLQGVFQPWWKYQIKIPDLTRFLKQIRLVLEKRIKNTMYSRLNRIININTYRECISIEFVSGKIRSIKNIGFQDGQEYSDIRSSKEDFVRMVLGQYSREEINEYQIDFLVRLSLRTLFETLFPKKESHISYYMV